MLFPRDKDTNKRGQKQARLHFAETEYLRRSQSTKSREQKQALAWLCRDGVSSAQPKYERSGAQTSVGSLYTGREGYRRPGQCCKKTIRIRRISNNLCIFADFTWHTQKLT